MTVDTGPPSLNILLVEDSPIIALNTEELLRELGASDVRVASSVAQAMAAIDEARFDLALLDLNLGEETSLPVAHRLAADGVPTVFVTGYGERLDLPDSLRDIRILKKPYNFNDLGDVVRSVQQG